MGKKGIEVGSAKEEDGADTKKQNTTLSEFIPPDGGYGWVIVLACGVANFCMMPLIQNFGLIYKDIMKEWKISTAEYSFILNFQFSVSNFAGLFAGPLLRMYGYRTMSLAGAVFIGVSSISTSQANTFYQFLIAYSIIGGVGLGVSWSSTALAVNTYFKRRRGIATGFCWTFTGLSPALTPFLVTFMMNNFDVHGTVLVLSGIILHNIPASLLMHPVEWHAKRAKVEEEEDIPVEEESKEMLEERNKTEDAGKVRSMEERIKLETPEKLAMLRHPRPRRDSVDILEPQSIIGLEFSAPVSLQSSMWSLAGESRNTPRRTSPPLIELSKALSEIEKGKFVQPPPQVQKMPLWKRMVNGVVEFFDLKLLADPRFLMIFIGVTLAFAGEVNFTLLTPFILAEKGLSTDKMALVMSILATLDLITRFTIPFLSDKYKLDSRLMYSVGLVFLASGRIMFAHLDGFYTIVFIALWCGLGKGFRTIYMALIIPSIVPIDRLAAASGLSMAANGLAFSLIGPLFGYIRDNSGNFVLPLHCINILTAGAMLCWIIEVIYSKTLRRQKKLKKRSELIYKEGINK